MTSCRKCKDWDKNVEFNYEVALFGAGFAFFGAIFGGAIYNMAIALGISQFQALGGLCGLFVGVLTAIYRRGC